MDAVLADGFEPLTATVAGPTSDAVAAVLAAAPTLTDIKPDVERCMTEPGPLLERLAVSIAQDWLGPTDRTRPDR